jgi:hypothetical protein
MFYMFLGVDFLVSSNPAERVTQSNHWSWQSQIVQSCCLKCHGRFHWWIFWRQLTVGRTPRNSLPTGEQPQLNLQMMRLLNVGCWLISGCSRPRQNNWDHGGSKPNLEAKLASTSETWLADACRKILNLVGCFLPFATSI